MERKVSFDFEKQRNRFRSRLLTQGQLAELQETLDGTVDVTERCDQS